MKYTLAVELKLIEIPDDEPVSMPRQGSDPLQGAVAVMTGAIGRFAHPMSFGPPAGFDFRKQITISVADFHGLAAIIGRFDELTNDIEHEKLQV